MVVDLGVSLVVWAFGITIFSLGAWWEDFTLCKTNEKEMIREEENII